MISHATVYYMAEQQRQKNFDFELERLARVKEFDPFPFSRPEETGSRGRFRSIFTDLGRQLLIVTRQLLGQYTDAQTIAQRKNP